MVERARNCRCVADIEHLVSNQLLYHQYGYANHSYMVASQLQAAVSYSVAMISYPVPPIPSKMSLKPGHLYSINFPSAHPLLFTPNSTAALPQSSP